MTMTEELPPEVEVELIDPEDLTGEEELLLDALRQAPPEEFDDLLRKHVAAPTESSQMVFRHPSIVQQTMDALVRLQASAQQRAQHARDKKMRQVYQDQVQKLGRERKAIRPWLNLAITEAAKHTPRARAEKMLGRIMYRDLTQIKKDFEAGLSESEVEARARERMGVGKKGPRGPRSTKT